MKKQQVLFVILTTVLCITFFGCEGMAELFHGPKPEGPTTYTVTFNANGGSGTLPQVQTVNPNTSITLPDGSGLSKSGYSFDGWNTNTSGTGTNYIAGSIYTVTSNITLYAKWGAGPTINVKQDNTVILCEGEYDFGGVFPNETKEVTFTIENTGSSDLIIETVNGNRINLTANSTNYFSVNLQPLSSTVAPGSRSTFSVKFTPTAVGNNFTAAVQIKTNSLNNNDFSFRVKGNGIRTYSIGETGPGGGMVFFAEGGQYKECSGELGSTDWGGAVTIAGNYMGGGFSDWNLPTRGELDLMYQNLHRMGLGGFQDTGYWSSEQSDTYNAWIQNFSSSSINTRFSTGTSTYDKSASTAAGAQDWVRKLDSFRVRAVRTF